MSEIVVVCATYGLAIVLAIVAADALRGQEEYSQSGRVAVEHVQRMESNQRWANENGAPLD